MTNMPKKAASVTPGNPYLRARLSTLELLIKIVCFVKKEKYNLKIICLSELVSTRRSTVLTLPLQ
jgi:hypothetical protein